MAAVNRCIIMTVQIAEMLIYYSTTLIEAIFKDNNTPMA